MPRGDRKRLKQMDEEIRRQLVAQRQALLDGASSSTSPSPSNAPSSVPSVRSDDDEQVLDMFDDESDGEWPEYDPATAIPVGTKFLDGVQDGSGKNKRGRATGIKTDKLVRMTRNKMNIKWNDLYRGPDMAEIDSSFAHDLGIAIHDNVKMLIDEWGKRSAEDMAKVLSYVGNKYNLDIEDRNLWTYVNEKAVGRFKDWKSSCHTYWKMHKKRIPEQFGTRPDQWKWLHKHFSSQEFQKKSKQNTINRSKLKMHHHAGSTSFAQLQGRRQLAKDPTPLISAFGDGYVGDPEGERHAARMKERANELLLERESQNPGLTQEEMGPLEADVEIGVLIEQLGERPGTFVRGCGRGVKRAPKWNGSSSTPQISQNDPVVKLLQEQNVELRQEIKEMKEEWNQKLNALFSMLQNQCQPNLNVHRRDEDSANGGGSANGLSVF